MMRMVSAVVVCHWLRTFENRGDLWGNRFRSSERVYIMVKYEAQRTVAYKKSVGKSTLEAR